MVLGYSGHSLTLAASDSVNPCSGGGDCRRSVAAPSAPSTQSLLPPRKQSMHFPQAVQMRTKSLLQMVHFLPRG